MNQNSPQRKKEKKSVYDVGYRAIFFRNFLQGFSNAIGVITAYIFLGGLIYYLAVSFVLPKLRKAFKTNLPLFTPTIQVQPSDPQGSQSSDSTNASQITSEDLQNALESLQEQGVGKE